MTVQHVSEVVRHAIPSRRVSDLMTEFHEREAQENEGVIVPMSSLRLTPEGTLEVPALKATFAFNAWSRRLLASAIGVRWSRWFFSAMPGADQANEVNRRFASRSERVLVRTNKVVPKDSDAQGTLLALLSDSFTPIADSKLLDLLRSALERVAPKVAVVYSAVTEMTTTYTLGIGTPFRPGDDHEVNDIWGGLTLRNSSVGAASLTIVASFTRLLCRNGLVAPIPDAVLVRKAHRVFDLTRLRYLLADRLRLLPGQLAEAGQVLIASREEGVQNVSEEFQAILRRARLPQALLPEIERAYDAEPTLTPSKFRVSMAITRAAQGMSAEVRFHLERAAGEYLSHLSPKVN